MRHLAPRHALLCLSLLAGLVLAGGTSARAQGAGECAALAGRSLGDSTPLGTLMLAARDGQPEHCRVTGSIRPAIGFELRLPTSPSGNAAREGSWNRRLLMLGCPGFCGTVDSASLLPGLRAGFAMATMDGGHAGRGIDDASWGVSTQARLDFGDRAVHATAVLAKAVIDVFYREKPARSFFAGYSNGGRQGVMAAQRHPEDFDGIVVGSPALNWTGMGTALLPWLTQVGSRPDGRNLFPPTKVRVIAGAVARACGDREGVVEDPRACRFKPASLLCRASDGADCLTSAEVKVAEAWYAGPGPAYFPGGVPYGSEPYWPKWLTGDGRTEGTNRVFAREFLRYLAFDSARGPAFDVLRDYDLARDVAAARAPAPIYDALDADLSRFAAHGGKLLIWQGWADAITTPEMVIDYYDAVRRKVGGNAEAFARLFVIPGLDHCGGSGVGPGPDLRGFDPTGILLRWVDEADPPAAIVVAKRDRNGTARWSRTICAWPKRDAGGTCLAPAGQ